MKHLKTVTTTALLTAVCSTSAMASDDGLAAVAAASALILSQLSSDSDDDSGPQVTFVPSIGYQNKRLDFDQKYTAGQNQGRKAELKTDIPTVNLSLTAAYEKFFATIKYETELAHADGSSKEFYPNPAKPLYYLNVPGENTDIEREDMSVTFGYNVWDKLNVFMGYMKGKTEFTPDPGCRFSSPATSCLPLAAGKAANLAFDNEWSGKTNYYQSYEEDGPYVGISYSWQIADAGSLSFSAAYADMDGEYRDNYAGNPNESFKYTGDSTGTSYGLTWTAPLGESSNYFLDLRQQEYDMDAKDATGFTINKGGKVETTETMTSVTAGVQFYY